jgi:hypothetical protein
MEINSDIIILLEKLYKEETIENFIEICSLVLEYFIICDEIEKFKPDGISKLIEETIYGRPACLTTYTIMLRDIYCQNIYKLDFVDREIYESMLGAWMYEIQDGIIEEVVQEEKRTNGNNIENRFLKLLDTQKDFESLIEDSYLEAINESRMNSERWILLAKKWHRKYLEIRDTINDLKPLSLPDEFELVGNMIHRQEEKKVKKQKLEEELVIIDD